MHVDFRNIYMYVISRNPCCYFCTEQTRPSPTNRHPRVRAHKVGVSLWDGSHSDLIKGPGQEAGECGDKWHSPSAGSTANPHPHKVLLRNEALNESVREGFLCKAFKTCEWCNIQHLDITLDDTISSIAITLTPFFLWEYECITITFKLRFKVLTKIFGYYFWKVFLILHNTFPLLYWYDSLCGQKHIPVDYKIFHFLQLSKF